MPYNLMTNFKKTYNIFCHFHLQKDVSTELGNLPNSKVFHWSLFITWKVHSFSPETMSEQNYETQLMEMMVNCENVFSK